MSKDFGFLKSVTEEEILDSNKVEDLKPKENFYAIMQ